MAEQGIIDQAKVLPEYLQKRNTTIRLKAGQTLLSEGDQAACVYLILSGKLRVVRFFRSDREYTLGYSMAGDFVCTMELICGYDNYLATVIAAEDSTLLRFVAREFDDCLRQDNSFLRSVSRNLLIPLIGSNYRSIAISTGSRREKLMIYLLNYYEKKALKQERIPIRITREQFAFELNTSLRTINRAVEELILDGFLSKDHRKLYMDAGQSEKMRAALQGDIPDL